MYSELALQGRMLRPSLAATAQQPGVFRFPSMRAFPARNALPVSGRFAIKNAEEILC
jgi:hypothetical protein